MPNKDHSITYGVDHCLRFTDNDTGLRHTVIRSEYGSCKLLLIADATDDKEAIVAPTNLEELEVFGIPSDIITLIM